MRRLLARTWFLGGCALAVASLVHCGGGDDDLTQGECDALGTQASIQRQQAQDAADRACATDADCVLFGYHLDCYEECSNPAAVSRSAVPALETGVTSINRAVCGAFEAGNCRPPLLAHCGPPLEDPPSAVCVDQTCELIHPRF